MNGPAEAPAVSPEAPAVSPEAPAVSRRRAALAGLALFGAALGLRLAYLGQARTNPLQDSVQGLGDSLYYQAWAERQAAGDWVGETAYYLGPLQHVVMGALYRVFGSDPEIVRVFQCVLGALSCTLLYWIGRRVFSERVGLLAGALLALYGLHVYYSALVLPTVLVLFLHLTLLLWLIPPSGSPSPGRCLGGGIAIGLAALAKANAVLLVPACLPVVWWWQRERPRSERVASALALVAGAALAIAPATLHNALASGELVPLVTSGGENLWKGNGPHANGTHVFLPADEAGAGLRAFLDGTIDAPTALRESERFRARTFEYVASHPGRSVALWLRKLALFWNAVELGVRDHFYFAKGYSSILSLPLPSFAWIAPLGLAGWLFAWRLGPGALLLSAVLVVQVASFVSIFILARYRIVAVACLILFASHLLFRLWDTVRRGPPRALAGPLAALAAAWLFVHLPLGFDEQRGQGLLYKRLGNLHFDAGDYPAAIAAYREALGRDWMEKSAVGEEADVRLRIAQAQARAGDRAAARRTALDLRTELGAGAPPAALRAIDAFLGELEPDGS